MKKLLIWGLMISFGGIILAPLSAFGDELPLIFKGGQGYQGRIHKDEVSYQGFAFFEGEFVSAARNQLSDPNAIRYSYGAASGVIPNAGSKSGPHLINHRSSVYAFWRGVGSDAGIYYSSFDGSTWQPQRKIPNVGSSEKPVIISKDQRLYMVWKGVGRDGGIYMTYSNDHGFTWQPQKKLNGSSGGGIGTNRTPAIAFWNSRLYVVWKGYSDQHLYYTYTDLNGTANPVKVIPDVGSGSNPVLVVKNNKMYLLWAGVTKMIPSRIAIDLLKSTTKAISGIPQTTAAMIEISQMVSDNSKPEVVNSKTIKTGTDNHDCHIYYSYFENDSWKPQQVAVGAMGCRELTGVYHNEKIYLETTVIEYHSPSSIHESSYQYNRPHVYTSFADSDFGNPTGSTGREVGGLDLMQVCKDQQGATGVKLRGKRFEFEAAYHWECENGRGTSMNMTEACVKKYGLGAVSKVRDVNDAYSWYCWMP